MSCIERTKSTGLLARVNVQGMGEMSEHRVTMLGASWRRFEDPARSRDPRIRTLVAALATLPAPELRAEFRAELRTQLVAIAPRVIAETADATAPLLDIVPGETPAVGRKPATAGARHSDSVFAKIRRIPIGRPLTVVASVITAFALLLGGAVWMSRKALPGDALYGLKRASENVQLALDGSATDKARDYLKFAGTRVDEARALASRASASAAGAGPQASGGIDSHTASLITSTLSSADSDVKSASSLLGTQAVRDKSSSPLDVITAWAPSQLSRLQELAAVMPAGALRTRTQSSAQLVTAAVTRARELAPNVSSACVDNAVHDDLGPMPQGVCTSEPATSPTTGQPTSVPGKPTPTGTAQGGTVVGSDAPNGPTSSAAATSGASESPTSGLHLPTLPLPTPTASIPVSVDTCGVGATLGPIGIGIGLCSGLHLSLTP
jgi:hypothetical protein